MLFLGLILSLGVAGAAEARQIISADKAKEIAFRHAQVNESDVRDLEIERDEDDGYIIYEIDFKVGNDEYEYVIDAESGKVLEYETDHKMDRVHSYHGDKRYIDSDRAEEIAFKKAGLTKNSGKIVKLVRYEKRGRMIYDIVLLSGSERFRMEIDAASGDIESSHHNRR